MKYKISARRWLEILEASPEVELDEDAFRNLKDNPYTGNSEIEFLEYIKNLPDQERIAGLDETNEDALWAIKGDAVELESIYCSAEKGVPFFIKGPTCQTEPE